MNLNLIDSSMPYIKVYSIRPRNLQRAAQSITTGNLQRGSRTPRGPPQSHAPQNHQPEPPPRFLLCGAGSDPLPFSRMANAHSAVALCGSVRFAFIQQLCSVPLSPSR